MTIKDAILKVLEEEKTSLTSTQIHDLIKERDYHDFADDLNSKGTVSSILSDFIKDKDVRINRIKGDGNFFLYFLNVYKEEGTKSILFGTSLFEGIDNRKLYERDLHPFLASYLENKDTFVKTIFHEKSDKEEDNYQKWIHPDMISVKFTKFSKESSDLFMRAVNINETFKITSYEIKKEINTDYELKKYYFQAVSNSSWAHNGYLVARIINNGLMDEIGRLNESFGIGLIQLDKDKEKTRVLFPAKPKKLDMKTIDKLSVVNRDFEKFISFVQELLSAEKKYVKALEKEFKEFCD